jgi:hypothetical protein
LEFSLRLNTQTNEEVGELPIHSFPLSDYSFSTLYAGTGTGAGGFMASAAKRGFSYIAVVSSRLLRQPVLVLPVGEQQVEINLRAGIHPAAAVVRAQTAEFYIFQIVGIFTCDRVPEAVR